MSLNAFVPFFKEEADISFLYKFTIFTPVYNAQMTINRVHHSLLNQTFTDFEWLIINDGSTDETDLVVKEMVQNSPLKINYICNSRNKHKMACFMEAIGLARGEFMLTLDADDECIPNALQIFNEEYNAIPTHLKSITSAITGLCNDQNGNLVGTKFPVDSYYSNTFETYALDNIKGEKWGFTKTKVLRGIKFNDEFVQNGFMQEGIIWNLLARVGYKTKYINKVLRIYHLNVENSISSTSMSGAALSSSIQQIVNFNWFFRDYFFKAPIFFLKNLYFLLRSSSYLDFNLKNYLTSLDSIIIKFFFVLLWPIRRFLR